MSENAEKDAAVGVERVLRENGLTDRPDLYDSSIHSWRCEHPDRYGPCTCFAELVSELEALCISPPGTAATLSLFLRQAAREHLGLADGDYWPSEVAAAQARALLDSGWVVIPPTSDGPA